MQQRGEKQVSYFPSRRTRMSATLSTYQLEGRRIGGVQASVKTV
jgi:hypothetical protein